MNPHSDLPRAVQESRLVDPWPEWWAAMLAPGAPSSHRCACCDGPAVREIGWMRVGRRRRDDRRTGRWTWACSSTKCAVWLTFNEASPIARRAA